MSSDHRTNDLVVPPIPKTPRAKPAKGDQYGIAWSNAWLTYQEQCVEHWKARALNAEARLTALQETPK